MRADSGEEVEIVVYVTPDELMIRRLHLAEKQQDKIEIGRLLSEIQAEPLRRILDEYEKQYGAETLVSHIGQRIDERYCILVLSNF